MHVLTNLCKFRFEAFFIPIKIICLVSTTTLHIKKLMEINNKETHTCLNMRVCARNGICAYNTHMHSSDISELHCIWVRSELYLTKQLKNQAFSKTSRQIYNILIASRPEITASNASRCSASCSAFNGVSIFGKRDKHSCSASASINLSMVSIVDSLLSTLHASVNHIFALWGQRIFHWLWLCGQSLFFFSGCHPRFLRLAARSLTLVASWS